MIVRALTKNPVCPRHPTLQVEILYRPPAYDQMGGVWVCSACNRPLGLASFAERIGDHIRIRFPQGRRPRPSDPPYAALDWDWFVRGSW